MQKRKGPSPLLFRISRKIQLISDKRPLTKKEQRRCKRIAAALLAFFSGICYLLCVAGHTAVAAYSVYAILMTALLQYPAIIQKRVHGK